MSVFYQLKESLSLRLSISFCRWSVNDSNYLIHIASVLVYQGRPADGPLQPLLVLREADHGGERRSVLAVAHRHRVTLQLGVALGPVDWPGGGGLLVHRDGGEGGGLLQAVEALGPGGEGGLAVQGAGVGGGQGRGHDLSGISFLIGNGNSSQFQFQIILFRNSSIFYVNKSLCTFVQ